MRSYDALDKYDVDEAEKLKAEAWMLDLLAMNPEYVHWGPGEDYMRSKDGSGWSSAMEGAWGDHVRLDELNELVNFHFQIERDGHKCEACGGSAENPETHQLSEDWYDFDRTGRKWSDKITQVEVDALWEAKRLRDFAEKPTPEQVNAWEDSQGFGHDAINRWICVEARAKHLGVYGSCAHCVDGVVFTADAPHVELVAWVIHPRKGASRGGTWRLTRNDLPEVFAWLREAAQRNAERFAKIPAPSSATE